MPEKLPEQTVVLRVMMHCEGCAHTVKRACTKIPGVTSHNVDFPGQLVTVTGKVDPIEVYRRIRKTGKQTEIVPQKLPPPAKKEDKKVEKKTEKKEEKKVEKKEEKEVEVKKEDEPLGEDKPKGGGGGGKKKKKGGGGGGGGSAAPKAEEKKEEKKEEEKPKEEKKAKEKKAAPVPQEDLYPVTFVLGQDYTRYYYY